MPYLFSQVRIAARAAVRLDRPFLRPACRRGMDGKLLGRDRLRDDLAVAHLVDVRVHQARDQVARRTGSPDRGYCEEASERLGSNRACLAIARKLLKRSYHTLRELGEEALQPA